ncbi:UTRA domain-containing protein [Desulfosarcina cetonica]|uniref:UTRA domain-containing protein n=1 Tax=Desulfosarcina cetonica TaxID=90730 RepID=UPI001FEF7EA7|nr:UTRA domain-containing protein [Desulfosarcina cetonica]
MCARRSRRSISSPWPAPARPFKKGIDVEVRLLDATRRIGVPEASENPFAGGQAFFLSRLSRVDGTPVLLEEIYLHPMLFAGIEEIDLTGRSLSQVVETRFYMRPTGGRQTFRIDRLDDVRARLMGVSKDTPILTAHRYLSFAQADNAVFSILYCNTQRFVFSQQIGGLSHE